jgi:squalene-associated FAD-dependent desaturase
MSTPRAHVAVLGGGLAGITAAIALAEQGKQVTLLEARPRLGGATTSFTRGDLVIDNGQHVFLRCCTAYRGLLARLGVTGSVTLQDRFDVTVLRPGGRATLRRTGLPGPLHMGRALAGYTHLSYAERLRVVPAALGMALLDPGRPGLDGRRLGDWLAARGQGERARRNLWDLFTVSSLNVAGDDANLALAATVVKTALLGAKDAADIGIPVVPLGDLHGRAGADLLGRLGAQVRLGAKAGAVETLPSGGFVVRLADPAAKSAAGNGGGVIRADGVVLAVPPDVAAKLWRWPGGTAPRNPPMPAAAAGMSPNGQSGNGSGPWGGLGSSPIVNVHVVYDRRVTRLPFAAAVDSPVQWVFDRTGPSGLRTGQYLAVSLSAADRYVDVPAARLEEEFTEALADLFPAAAQARVVDCFVTRERRATFRQEPGCEGLRPQAKTAVPGLVLAGAWTDTGWPDTMEGAVRSGLNAARELRHALAGDPALRWGPDRSGPAQPPAQADLAQERVPGGPA